MIDNVFKVEKILKTRNGKNGKEFYVKWQGYNNDHNSWVKENDLIN